MKNGIDYTILPKYCLIKELANKERFMEIRIDTEKILKEKFLIGLYLDGELFDYKILGINDFMYDNFSTLRVRAEKPNLRYLDYYTIGETSTKINLRSIEKFFICPPGLHYNVYTATCLYKCDYSKDLNVKNHNCTCSNDYKDFIACPLSLQNASIFIKSEIDSSGLTYDYL